MKYVITIETGNEAMQGREGVGRALRALGKRFENVSAVEPTRVFDLNGNQVGTVECIDE